MLGNAGVELGGGRGVGGGATLEGPPAGELTTLVGAGAGVHPGALVPAVVRHCLVRHFHLVRAKSLRDHGSNTAYRGGSRLGANYDLAGCIARKLRPPEELGDARDRCVACRQTHAHCPTDRGRFAETNILNQPHIYIPISYANLLQVTNCHKCIKSHYFAIILYYIYLYLL